jgi:hypothetical protein
MTSQQRDPQKVPRLIWIGWLIVTGLLAWNILRLWPTARPGVNIPYTTFLAQVRADNIARVRVAGDLITGSFVLAEALLQEETVDQEELSRILRRRPEAAISASAS